MPNIVSQCREWIPTSTSERTGGLKKTKMLRLNNPNNRDDKDSDRLAHSRCRGSYTWTTCVKSPKQEFSSNVSQRSSAGEKMSQLHQRTLTDLHIEN